MIELGQWAPDAGSIGKGQLREARNVIPGKGYYGPWKAAATVSDAVGARPVGLWSMRDAALGVHTFAGFLASLRERNSDGTWTDRSKVGGYSGLPTSRWRAAQYQNLCVAVNGVDANQVIDLGVATAFSDLAGSPPVAKFVMTIGQFLAFGNTANSAAEIAWSGIGAPTEYSNPQQQAGAETLGEGGPLTGMGSFQDVGTLFQEQLIRRMVYQGGGVVWDFNQVVEDKRGMPLNASGSQAKLGRHFFQRLSDGFYRYNDAEGAVPIGNERVDDWFLSDAPIGYWDRMSADIDPLRKLYVLCYASAQSGGTPDSLLVYNWSVNRWSYVRGTSCELVGRVLSPGYSLEDLDAIYGDLDSIPISLDDPSLAGGALTLGGMSATGAALEFSGANREALIVLDDISGGRSVINHQGALPFVDASSFGYSVDYRLEPADVVTTTDETTTKARGGWYQRRATGRLLRPRFRIPAGATWTKFEGVDFNMAAESEL